MPIACGHCEGVHDFVAQVRACALGHPADPTEPVSPGPADPTPPVSPGPAALGRNLVVRPGQQAPAPWQEAGRVVVDTAVLAGPDAAITTLRERALSRQRTVIELAVAFDQPPDAVDARPTFVIGARGRLPLEELHHLVWSHSIDARTEPARFALRDVACALGARPDGPGDVVLPDGTPVWLDGGPLHHADHVDGVAVMPALAVEHGRLAPFGSNQVPDGLLAPDQLAAVTHPGGTARIIAPAGSGKTRVLTERARHLVTRWGLPASAVSLVAYNRRAQEEMAERTADVPGLQIRTLNGLALAIVNGSRPFAPRPSTVRTIDEREVRRILGRLVDLPARRNQDPLAPWIEAMRAVRLELLSPEAVEQRAEGDVDGLSEVWPQYTERLAAEGAADFDHQIHLALGILLTDPAARRAAQRAHRVVLVDEFQDLTPAHLLLIRLLAGPGGAVFGVGDDDQTIYGYQGADPDWLIDFATVFPGAGDHPLEVNYRCPAAVVEAAGTLLSHNRRRVPKVLRPAAPPDPEGLAVRTADGPAAAVEATVAEVTAAIAGGTAPADIAVLTRVNSLLAPVQVALGGAGVPVRGGPGTQLLTRTAVRAVLAWLRLGASTGSLDAEDLGEALRRPSRSLHPRVATWVTEQRSVEGLERLATRVRTDRDAERVRAFAADITRVARAVQAGASTQALVRLVAHDLGVGEAVSTLDHHRHGSNATAQSDDLLALEQLAAQCASPARFDAWLAEVLGRPDQAEGVQLATVHRVKGQEWPVVVVHEADRDQFPHRLADDVEEERRVFHVAITRASRRTVVVCGEAASPFVAEMQGRASEITVAPGRSRGTATSGGTAGSAARARPADVAAVRPRGPKVLTTAEASAESVRAFAHLRQMRDRVRNGKPAYIVFNDATLEAIARALPRTLAELARISGVGPAKLEMYGEAVLLAVEDALAEA